MNIRAYAIPDTEEILNLFYDTIHEVNSQDYTPEQVNAWAPAVMDTGKWRERLSRKMTFVAEADGQIVGFCELEKDGHIDCFYAHKDYQRKGVGRSLLAKIEQEAKALGVNRVYAEVSITAKPFFESQGFVVLQEQQVLIRGINLTNYRMEKIW